MNITEKQVEHLKLTGSLFVKDNESEKYYWELEFCNTAVTINYGLFHNNLEFSCVSLAVEDVLITLTRVMELAKTQFYEEMKDAHMRHHYE